MQAVIKMIKFLYKLCIRLIVVYLIFMGLAWMLLGMHPKETWGTSVSRLNSLRGAITGYTNETTDVAGQMSKAAQKQLDAAKDRFHGIDPYENYNKELDQKTKEVQ